MVNVQGKYNATKIYKGGVEMLVDKIVVKAGYEEIHDKLVEMKERLEEKVRLQVAEEARTIDNMMAECTEVIQVEVEDEVNEEIVEE